MSTLVASKLNTDNQRIDYLMGILSNPMVLEPDWIKGQIVRHTKESPNKQFRRRVLEAVETRLRKEEGQVRTRFTDLKEQLNLVPGLIPTHSEGLCHKADVGHGTYSEAFSCPPHCSCCGSVMKVDPPESMGHHQLGIYMATCPICPTVNR